MSNCWLFALHRWVTRGGYVVVRRSHWGWWPHALWSADLVTFEDYAPVAGRHRYLPPLLFRGAVRTSMSGEYDI